MQTNQLSHFLLTSTVWPSLKTAAEKRGEARVVTHSSSARDQPSGDLKKEYFTKSEAGTLGGDKTNMMLEFVGFKGPWTRYHQTKLANSAFTMELHRRLQEKGITNIKAMSADPGLATSNLQVTSTQHSAPQATTHGRGQGNRHGYTPNYKTAFVGIDDSHVLVAGHCNSQQQQN